ncbi:hypothetical protein CVT24_011841 [Panaeolus cyanescens]|uniref:SAP domain-containing protein n=1 Tax=Panaeolus cyanescens TaxID=181874 RepID=A0A409YNR8_9AGAR|nr:hypothetical protein CVT24_011841 [Panaeolus cyanescens]
MNEPVIDPVLLHLSTTSRQTAQNSLNSEVIPESRITTQETQSNNYNKLQHTALKKLCRERNLKVGGNKAELTQRLLLDDQTSQVPGVSTSSSIFPPASVQDRLDSTAIPAITNIPSSQSDETLNVTFVTEVLQESESLVGYFDQGLESVENHDGEESDEEAEVAAELANATELEVVDNSTTHAAIIWADNFILETRRKGGRQTEMSVLKQWKAWVTTALDTGIIPDMIIDSVHIIEYLKYAATRNLFTTYGAKKTSTSRLSASSLKKIMTMLGRVRRRQEDTDPSLITKRPAKNSRTDDFFRALMVQAQRYRLESADFDITQGTILDSQLRPEQFDEITEAILTKLTQLPSIIKAHFSWTWQCATLNRSDEVVSMTLASIHPYNLPLPNYTYQDGRISATGREVFGVLAMFHETKTAQPGKTEPVYSFALPHRDPLMCSVSALAILLHFMFDQKDLIGCVSNWNWMEGTTWQMHHVVFGKNVNEPMGGDGLGRMYSSFLDFTTVNSTKKTHLARRTMPSKLEEMGVPADQLKNTKSAVALAGFPVGESYYVPWSQVPVPDSLQLKLYPFCEDTLALLRANGCKNQGMMNFLILLQNLRPFFWRVIGAINYRFPKSPLVQRLKILEDSDAKKFLHDWPTLCKQEEHTRHQSLLIEQAFQEKPTQNAFAAVVSEIRDSVALEAFTEQSLTGTNPAFKTPSSFNVNISTPHPRRCHSV